MGIVLDSAMLDQRMFKKKDMVNIENDLELEDWLRSVERPQIRRPISFLEERVVMLEGKLGEVVRLIIREVEEERRERIRMGWYLAFSQGTIFALLLILWRRTSQ